MKEEQTVIISNTLERVLPLAQSLCRELRSTDRKTQRSYRVFVALTQNDIEAWAAFLIWKALGRSFKVSLDQK